MSDRFGFDRVLMQLTSFALAAPGPKRRATSVVKADAERIYEPSEAEILEWWGDSADLEEQRERARSPPAKRPPRKATRKRATKKERAAAQAARDLEAERKKVAATLERQAKTAARSKAFPTGRWAARFWLAVAELHPGMQWDNAARREVYASVVRLWRAHRWSPEEGAQAVCARCEELAEPLQGASVASSGRTLTARVKAPRGVPRASELAPPALPVEDFPRVRGVKKPVAKACPVEKEECSFTAKGGTCTITAPLTVPARGGGIGTERIRARYCVVEIAQIHTSHDPLRGFAPDPAFPVGAQERDYRQTAERAKVEEIAQHFDPALVFNTGPGAIDGVPVATEDGVVLGGNGRTMGTRLVYAGRGGVEADTPRAYLIDHAYEFGLEPETIELFKAPMLVRTVRTKNDARSLAEMSRRLNTSLSQQLDATHLAVSRARFLDESALRELGQLADDETLAAFLASPRSRAFVRSLQTSGVIDGRAAQTYLTSSGLLNEAGRDLVADLLVAVLLPDADMIAAYGKGPVGTLARAAAPLVQVSQWPEFDIRPALGKAVRDRITMREQDFSRVADYLRQGGLFGSTGAAVEGDAAAIVLLAVLSSLEAAPVKFTRFAKRYAQLAAPGGAGQGGLFATETRTPLEALREAATEVGVKLP